jgi:hypothetical protein
MRYFVIRWETPGHLATSDVCQPVTIWGFENSPLLGLTDVLTDSGILIPAADRRRSFVSGDSSLAG